MPTIFSGLSLVTVRSRWGEMSKKIRARGSHFPFKVVVVVAAAAVATAANFFPLLWVVVRAKTMRTTRAMRSTRSGVKLMWGEVAGGHGRIRDGGLRTKEEVGGVVGLGQEVGGGGAGEGGEVLIKGAVVVVLAFRGGAAAEEGPGGEAEVEEEVVGREAWGWRGAGGAGGAGGVAEEILTEDEAEEELGIATVGG
jgi:hypothetical protein